jgi:uncharacterized membrane protein
MRQVNLLSRIFYSLVSLLVASFIFVTPAFSQLDTGWEITSFNSDIIINQDTSVQVTETLEVDFKNLSKHGIFRLIPVDYRTGFGNNLNIRFKLLSVTNQVGDPIPVQVSKEGSNIKLKIGDPDITISGQNTYLITYSINRVITTPHETAEFYWNVTGNGWPVPINQATATITTPTEAVLNTICFTGYLGSTQTNCLHEHDGSIARFSSINLGASEGLTVSVALDQDTIIFPKLGQKLIWFLVDNWVLLTPIVVLIVMLRLYWTRGRDKKYQNIFSETGQKTIPLFEKINALSIYGPPKNLSPGEVGVLIDEKVHMQDITAIMIDLARRGFLTVKDKTKKALFSKTEIELTNNKQDESELLDFEKSILDMLFGSSRKETVTLNKLPSNSYKYLEIAQKELYEHLTTEGYFSGNPNKVRWTYIGIAIAIFFVGVTFVGPIFAATTNSPVMIFSMLFSSLIIFVFSFFMPSRTPKGRKALKEVVGLKEWIRIGAWREQIHEKHNFLEEVLPYTIAFGLTYKFLKAFKESDLKDLSWYQSSRPITISTFNHSLSSFNNSVTRGVAATRPASSGGSGFSGGGSSGGGSGGGGGGSW